MHSCFAFDKKRRTKRVLSLALALALVFSAVAFLPQTVNAATTGTVTASALNVRSGPGTNYASLGLLQRGTSVTVESVSGGWAQISYNGKTAYVSAEYVSMSASQPSDGGQTTGGETDYRHGDGHRFQFEPALRPRHELRRHRRHFAWHKRHAP